MYKIIFDRSAERDLDHLSSEVIRRIVKVINDLAANPRPTGVKKLKVSNENLHRIRSGDITELFIQ